MKTSWIEFLSKIETQIAEFEKSGCDTFCYRGHAESCWNLEPSIYVKLRKNDINVTSLNSRENVLFFDFVTNSAQLLNNNITDWEILFTMRHHGIPTRLLDWTESFGNALYFALYGNGTTPTIWMMNPYEINKLCYTSETIPNPLKDFNFGYVDSYIDKKSSPFHDPIVIIPPRNSDRLFAQKGLFTLQGTDNTPLNLNPKLASLVKKFEIPFDAIDDAKLFLKLAGINHYSIFPDLDGLSKHLNEIHGLE